MENEADTASKTVAQPRARIACDACRARKVRCRYHDGQTACQACQDLEVECTTNRPRKRRGPPSKYIERLRNKQEQPNRTTLTTTVSPKNPEQQSGERNGSFTLEDLAPLFIIQQVIDDWFELIHPVAPILHRGKFLKQLRDPQASNDAEFAALVASICAATVATLRRRTSEYISLVTVEQCDAFIRRVEQIRDPTPLTLGKCLVRYNMAAALGKRQGLDDPTLQVQMAELTAMVGYMVHYDMQTLSFCDQELLKRLYVLCFAANCTLGLHGRPSVTHVSTPARFRSLMPRDLPDENLCDTDGTDDPGYERGRSYVSGLLALNDMFMLWYRSQQGDVDSMAHLQTYLDLVLSSLDHIPPELRWRGGLSRPPRSNLGTDVQMVNLYITQVHIRMFLLDQMYQVATSQNAADLRNITSARQNLVDDMLAIVYQVPEDVLAANGISLIYKIRDIGLALLNDTGDPEQSLMNLDRLLAKLERLDVQLDGQDNSISPTVHSTSPMYNT